MSGWVRSVKRLVVILVLLIIIAISTNFLYDLLLPEPSNEPFSIRHTIRILLMIMFSIVILIFIIRSRTVIARYIGDQATTIVQFFLGTIAILVMTFAVLNTLGVSPDNLLLGAGIVSITIGVIISTFVGGILSGGLVFITHRFRVGDTVIINNIPGKVTNITALATRVRTDAGQITVPNSAIASGAVIITRIFTLETLGETRLPYVLGDRVITTYMQGEGVVKELTPLHTVILLDSGKELKFLNYSVLSGSVAVAKLTAGGEKSDKEAGAKQN